MHYNTHRYYDPVAARYLTPDPLGLAVGPDLYAFALNRPQSVSDPLGLEPTLVLDGAGGVRTNTTNTSLAGWRYEDKLKATVTRAIPLLPGEVGAALQEMVKPENLAAVGAVMVVFAGIQFIPGADVVIDLIVAGAAVYMLGSGAIDLIKTLVTLDANISSAKCAGDLDLAAKALAAGLVKSSGAVVGGAAAGYGSISSGGIRRIADGIHKVTEFAKGRFGVSSGVGATASGTANTVNGARLNMQLSAEQVAGTRAPATITSYSEHAVTQISGRDGGIGVSQAAINDAFANPVSIQYVPSKYGPTFKYIGKDATVVVNPEGKAVTTWATNSAGTGK